MLIVLIVLDIMDRRRNREGWTGRGVGEDKKEEEAEEALVINRMAEVMVLKEGMVEVMMVFVVEGGLISNLHTLVIGREIVHRERRKCIILRESGSWRTDWSFLQNSWCCG